MDFKQYISKVNFQSTSKEHIKESLDPTVDLEEEILALGSQADSVIRSMQVFMNMLVAGPSWAQKELNRFIGEFSKFRDILVKDDEEEKEKSPIESSGEGLSQELLRQKSQGGSGAVETGVISPSGMGESWTVKNAAMIFNASVDTDMVRPKQATSSVTKMASLLL